MSFFSISHPDVKVKFHNHYCYQIWVKLKGPKDTRNVLDFLYHFINIQLESIEVT